MTFEVPILCRLEYLTPEGWVMGHAGIALLHPAKYVERLEARGKFGRCTELGDDLQPTGPVWLPSALPDPAVLVPDPPLRIPRLPDPNDCPYCATQHAKPYDGGCLI